MFDIGGMCTSSFGRFTPHLCLIPSMHDSYVNTALAGWSAHELVFSDLSWPTLDTVSLSGLMRVALLSLARMQL